MRAILAHSGTMGDFQPFLALAVAMRKRGHEVAIGFSPNFAKRVTEFGIEFIPIGPDLRAEQERANRAMSDLTDPGASLDALMRPLVLALPQAFEDLRAACSGADVLISGPALPAGRMVHETTGIPFVSVQLSHFGGIGSPALQQASTDLINPVRARFGLAPLRNPLTIDANSPQLALYAMSRHVRPPQPDWPAHYHITGPFFLEEEWQPDPALEAFMAAGPAPVVFTFGSMTHEDPRAVTKLLRRVVETLGCRAIIQKGWSGLGQDQLPESIFAIDYTPFGWLFPRAACVVHHGGAGTASWVFRSGVPSVFVPHGFLFDQTYWARLAEDLGCAGPTIPYGELDAGRLDHSLSRVLGEPAFAQAAAELGRKVRGEHGVQSAAQLIEKLVDEIGLATLRDGAGADAMAQSAADRADRRRAFQKRRRG